MKKKGLFIAMFFTIFLALTSCSKDSAAGGEGPEGTELGGTGLAGGGEGPEGTETGGGAEGTGGEAGNESGTLWDIMATADETVNGLRLILSFDPASNTFSGTLENTNSSIVPQTRIEVHVFDANNVSTEFGPTPGVDMQPGAIRNVSLVIAGGLNPVQFNMHPEFGSAGAGG